MNLRVFSDGGDFAYAEISSRSLPYHNKLFVPLLPANSPLLEEFRDVDEKTTVSVFFEEKRFIAYCVSIRNINIETHNLKIIGDLGEDDSRNILNHFLDFSAYVD